MIKLLALAALLLASPAKALISVMEGLPTTRDAVFVGTTTPQLILNATSYNGTVPTVSLYVSSNSVFGSNGCIIYSTGVIVCLGVRVSTSDPAGTYVPYTGAIADVNLGTHKMLAAQFGAGTTPSTNFLFDGLSTTAGYIRIAAGTNLATGYYWGGTRGYSMQERYDLATTPFTLHDELNNVDRFSLDTSGGWYYPASVTISSLTVLSASVGISGATENVNASMIGNGSLGASLGVSPSSVAVLNGSGFVVNAQIDHSSVPFLSGGLINNYQIDHASVPFLVSSLINNSQISVSSVARLNASGLIPNYQIDPSSIAKLNSSGLIQNYQIDPSSVNKVIGISSGPAGSAQFLENATIVDGVVVGGDFASASGGGSTFFSSDTLVNTTAPTQSIYAICSGTVSVVTGTTAFATFSGYMIWGNNTRAGWGVLVNGALGNGGFGAWKDDQNANPSAPHGAGNTLLLTGLSAGTNNFCIACAANAGACQFGGEDSSPAPTARSHFTVWGLK